ncbi:hypothetical protein U1Q18_008215 [Sarracenia purpurea var. burkii]
MEAKRDECASGSQTLAAFIESTIDASTSWFQCFEGGECLGFRNPELAKLWINSLSRNPDPLQTSAAQCEGLLDVVENHIARFTGGVLFSRKTRDAQRRENQPVW